jgi:hypothetical protein
MEVVTKAGLTVYQWEYNPYSCRIDQTYQNILSKHQC